MRRLLISCAAALSAASARRDASLDAAAAFGRGAASPAAAALPQLRLAPCAAGGSPSQSFTVNGGGIGVIAPSPNSFDACLCAPQSGGSGALTLETCEGAGAPLHDFEVGFAIAGGGAPAAAIPWSKGDVAPASGLCVAAAAAGAAPELQPCSGAPAQQWVYASSQLSAANGLCFEASAPPPPLASSVFGSGMVLQRGESAAVWGFGATPGGAVSVSVTGAPAVLSEPAAASGAWAVSLPPRAAGTGYNVTIVDLASGRVQVLVDVAWGDVYWCGGQSNLSGGNTPLAYAFNATAEIAASAMYPWVRLFTVGTPPGSDTPLAQLQDAPSIPWSRAAPDAARRFSATCWFTGRRLADALGAAVPLGLVESAWGGTSIQVWLPPSSAQACGAPPSYPGGWPTALSACWNSQTAPFAYNTTPFAYNNTTHNTTYNTTLSLKISGIVFYQGESNALTAASEAAYYKCALPYLVQSLRTLFQSPGAHAAIVQLAPWASSAAALNGEVAALRQAQLEAGDAPSTGISVITAVDGGDPFGPIGSIHPRGKKPVGERLGAALLTALYGMPTPFAGPRLARVASGGGAAGVLSATLTFTSAAALVLIAPAPIGPYANSSVCPVGVGADLCAGFMLQGAQSGAWYNASAALTAGGDVLLTADAPGETRAIAAASGWSLWPITLLYDSNGLPAFPFNMSV